MPVFYHLPGSGAGFTPFGGLATLDLAFRGLNWSLLSLRLASLPPVASAQKITPPFRTVSYMFDDSLHD
jgi:hypothetical protein